MSSKAPLRKFRRGPPVRTEQSWHGMGNVAEFPSSVHSHAFPPRSDCPHFPSPLGDFDPTFSRLLHVPPQ